MLLYISLVYLVGHLWLILMLSHSAKSELVVHPNPDDRPLLANNSSAIYPGI